MADLTAAAKGRGQIVWLASYPKSGNTWVRSLLTAYLQRPDQALDINHLSAQGAAARASLDELLGLATAELTRDELRRLLPHAFRAWSAQSAGPVFLKTHDAYDTAPGGEPVFPASATRCVVHLVRDPRDVAVSAMHHWGLGLDATIARLNNPGQWVGADDDEDPRVAQKLSDWSGHTRSWLDCPLPRLTLRYEDLLADPGGSFRRILDFIGLAVDAQRLALAVDSCGFDRLRAQEQAGGFVERKRSSTAPFFRAGQAGGWRQVLSPAQAKALVDAHGDLMRQLGYGA